MNKAELIERLTEKAGDVPKPKVAQMIESMLNIITETIKAGGEVTLSGFGEFSARTRKGRVGINPQTKEQMQIPPVRVPKFKAGKTLKDALRAKDGPSEPSPVPTPEIPTSEPASEPGAPEQPSSGTEA